MSSVFSHSFCDVIFSIAASFGNRYVNRIGEVAQPALNVARVGVCPRHSPPTDNHKGRCGTPPVQNVPQVSPASQSPQDLYLALPGPASSLVPTTLLGLSLRRAKKSPTPATRPHWLLSAFENFPFLLFSVPSATTEFPNSTTIMLYGSTARIQFLYRSVLGSASTGGTAPPLLQGPLH